ncbi:MAG: hypothetical protein WKF48_05695 [Solirubrobacteraceae bacterium]
MTVAIVALSLTVVLLALVLAAGTAMAQRSRRELESQLRAAHAAYAADGYAALVDKQVTANVRDGGAIRGVLTRVYANAIVISHPEFVGRSQPAGIGAEVVIDRAAVPMLQRFES